MCASSSTSASSGLRGDHRVEVHLGEHEVAVLGAQARHLLDAVGERGGLGPVVRLEVADHDVTAVVLAWRPSCSIR